MTENRCTIHGDYRTDDTSGQCPVCKGGGVVWKYCALHGNYEATWANDKLSDCPSCEVNIFAPGTWKCLNCDIHNAGPRVSCWRCGWNTKLGDPPGEDPAIWPKNPATDKPWKAADLGGIFHGVSNPKRAVKPLIDDLRAFKTISSASAGWHPTICDRAANALEDLLGLTISAAAVKPPDPPLWELNRLQTEDGKKPRYCPVFQLDLNGIGHQILYLDAQDSMGQLWDVLQQHFDAQQTVATPQKADEDGGRFETPPIIPGSLCECRVYFNRVNGAPLTPPGYAVVNSVQAAKVDCAHCRGTGVVQPRQSNETNCSCLINLEIWKTWNSSVIPDGYQVINLAHAARIGCRDCNGTGIIQRRPPSPDPAGVGTLSPPAGLTLCKCGDSMAGHADRGRGRCMRAGCLCTAFQAE